MESTHSRNESFDSDSKSKVSDAIDLGLSDSSSSCIECPSEISFDASSINDDDTSLDVCGLMEKFGHMNISKDDDLNISEMERETRGIRNRSTTLLEVEEEEEEEDEEEGVRSIISKNSVFSQERNLHESVDLDLFGLDDDVQDSCPNISAIERVVNLDEEEAEKNATFLNIDNSLCQTEEEDSLTEAIDALSSVSVLKCSILNYQSKQYTNSILFHFNLD